MTKGDIDRLGHRIGASMDVSVEDLNMLQEYRQTFQKPIADVFGFVLQAARKVDRQCIVTYRIKRIDTIVEKLRRFHNNPNGEMHLSRMWDIAGCRCILKSMDEDKLYQLLDRIKAEYGDGCKVNDHVDNPKPSGYRSIHIYVKDKLTQTPIEIQIRNQEQHNWATLVEIIDLLYGTKNKEGSAESMLGRFLYLYSIADGLNDEQSAEMHKIEQQFKVFEKMSNMLTRNYLNIRKQWLRQKTNGNYYVITANRKGSDIVSYRTFEEAEAAYYERYLANSDSNIVLTHLMQADFSQISVAYSNYVLAMHAFFDDYQEFISKKIIQSLKDGEYIKYANYFKTYKRNTQCHLKNLQLEINSISECNSDATISKSQIVKWVKEIKSRANLWVERINAFVEELKKEMRGNLIKVLITMNNVSQLQKAVKG